MSTTLSAQSSQTRELVINGHITEACNYRCSYCYAKWQDHGMGRELVHDSAGTKALLEEIHRFFSPGNLSNPLRRDMAWDSLRLNLAGGEPLLYEVKAIQTIKLARQIGFETSVITNGSRLNPALMAELAPDLSILGLSLDSSDDETNQGIGRADRHSQVLSMSELADVIGSGRRISPVLRLKINTVVNALNWREDMNEFVRSLAPDKWKVLRMLPMVTDELAVSATEFNAFVQRHQALKHVMRAEDNSDMAESYIMIDPHGRFFENRLGRKGYEYSPSILDAGAATAFSQVTLSVRKFCSRYAHDLTVKRA